MSDLKNPYWHNVSAGEIYLRYLAYKALKPRNLLPFAQYRQFWLNKG